MASTVEDQGAAKLVAITPSDTVTFKCRALWVGGAGDVALVAEDDTAAVVLSSVPAGTIVPVKAQKVMSTSTTATLIVALR